MKRLIFLALIVAAFNQAQAQGTWTTLSGSWQKNATTNKWRFNAATNGIFAVSDSIAATINFPNAGQIIDSLGFTPENVINKVGSIGLSEESDYQYPNVTAVNEAVTAINDDITQINSDISVINGELNNKASLMSNNIFIGNQEITGDVEVVGKINFGYQVQPTSEDDPVTFGIYNIGDDGVFVPIYGAQYIDGNYGFVVSRRQPYWYNGIFSPLALNDQVLLLSGDQTASGNKVFSGSVRSAIFGAGTAPNINFGFTGAASTSTWSPFLITPGASYTGTQNGALWYETTNSRLRIYRSSQADDFLFIGNNYSLSGVGSRAIEVDASGNLSATKSIRELFTTDSDVITAITGASYTSDRATISPSGSKVFYQGQYYDDGTYTYLAINDNEVRRW